ncbi:MAG: tRNA epoxyqueuosine(34) reductase QueG, partial [Methylophilaceae bacterium]|nr:tRNA epoxyqueuosine(34) reductase QueG [Methylophilaceae bacterium]
QQWLRNIAIGLGNAPSSPSITQALNSRKENTSDLVREHIEWALAQHASTSQTTQD